MLAAARPQPPCGFREKLIGYGIQLGAPADILWNFENFLVDRGGNVVARFAPDVPPNDPLIIDAIERAIE